MKRGHCVVSWFLLALWPAALFGQAAPPPPPAGPSPLLYLRLVGPAGSRFGVFQGGAAEVPLASPASIAVRPGYVYRLKLTDLKNHPGVALYPTVEVHGSLFLPPMMQPALHPAPVVLSEAEVVRVLAGVYVTKVIVLEHPDKAAPVATAADQPLESEMRAHEDIMAHARALGRPMLVVRLGGRTTPPDDLALGSIPNTVLFPGGKPLGQPPLPPLLPWACHGLFDPRLGPRFPEEECLQDGGDVGRAAGLDHLGKLQGLDPSDTVAEYADSKGQKRLAISNRVCLCVPRYAVLRTQIVPTGYDSARVPGGTGAVLSHSLVKAKTPSLEAVQRENTQAMRGRESPGTTLQTTALVVLEGLWGTSTILGWRSGQEIVGTLEKQIPESKDRPLELYKWTDRHSAQVGDVVTFYLKYVNVGGQSIQNVALSDSLTGRLEYVPGSARSDRPCTFTTRTNEAGSVVLRWANTGTLPAGESGMVSFQARVR